MYNLLLGFLLALICACDSGYQNNADGKPTAAATRSLSASAAKQNMAYFGEARNQHKPLPTPEELDKADRIIAYSNHVNEELDNGFYSLASKLYDNSRRYTQTWQLPPLLKKRKRADLAPEEGLFDEAEARLITDGLKRMDKALDSILTHYAGLEKYAADDRIRDDGRQAHKLAARIKNDHAAFIAARSSWLDTVRKRAAEAEKIMLYGHPLQRQIIAGNTILNQLREVNNILASGSPEPSLLHACSQNIVTAIGEGTPPPFPARPAQERLYRVFLKSASAYREQLEMAVNEGFHPAQLRQIQDAARACANAWNDFAKETNSHAQ